MTFKDKILKNAKEAYRKGDLTGFLRGSNGYAVQPVDAPVDVPTDWPRVIRHGIYAIYEETDDPEIILAFESAMLELCSGQPEDAWIAAHVLYFQRNQEMLDKSPFTISPNISGKVRQSVIDGKPGMSALYPYGKAGYNMYEDTLRLAHNFARDWKEELF